MKKLLKNFIGALIPSFIFAYYLGSFWRGRDVDWEIILKATVTFSVPATFIVALLEKTSPEKLSTTGSGSGWKLLFAVVAAIALVFWLLDAFYFSKLR